MLPGGLKKLEIGGDKNRMLFLVALSAVIVLGLGVTVWVFFGGSKEQTQAGKTDSDMNFKAGERFQCARCGKEFRMTDKDWNAMREGDRSLGPVSRLPNCPHCGAKHTGLQMVKCLKCGKLYVPYGLKIGLESLRDNNGELPPGTHNICPHCGTDQDEYSKKLWHK